jgi:hypothetical protein
MLAASVPKGIRADPGRVYRGERDLDGATTVTVDGSALRRREDLSRSVARFDWGYAGPGGPTQLSLAILVHHFGDERLARRYCAHFLRSIVAHLGAEQWMLTSGDIAATVPPRRDVTRD